ncbi:MAG: lipopolysaccharide transport periplasmic protein LptA [Gammaproteobacteria bacterium]|nr:lipopolysaccharide transport periplasmic protein LptA [Gammaproteobacteria bacterium]
MRTGVEMRPGRDRPMRYLRFAALTLPLLAAGTDSLALESDRDQPATLEADDIELDLRTGVRTYRGDVVYRQGSIRLDCDELVTRLNDDGELDTGVCTGNPGRFRQRPEGSGEDVVGEAVEITMDQTDRLVTLGGQARVTQGPNTVTGRLITYGLDTDKVLVKGGVQTSGSASGGSTGGETAGAGAAVSGGQPEDAASRPRARLVIQPRKQQD